MLELKKAIRTAQNFFPGLVGAKNDFYYVTRRYLGFAHERDFRLIAHLPRREDDLFIDIGGNRGQSILSIRRYRPDARIMSFEPNPVIFRELSRRFGAMPGVTLENVGLGPAPGELTLYVPSYRGFLYDGIATFEPHAARAYFSPETLYFYRPGHVTVAEHRCPVRTLDSFGLAPSFVKIDVEGYEHAVLRGATETLRRHEPTILVERFWHDDRVFDMLGGLGYAEVRLEGGRLVRARGEGLNAVMMTEARFAAAAVA
jgi:FkbM family methyltransferase